MQHESRQSARDRKHGGHAQDGGEGDVEQRAAKPDGRATDGDAKLSEQREEGEPGKNAGVASSVTSAQDGENGHEAGYGQDSGFGETKQGSSNDDVSDQVDPAAGPNRGVSTDSPQGEGRGDMPQPQTHLAQPGESGWGQRNDERGSVHIGGGQQRDGDFEYGGPGSHQEGGSPADLPSHPDVGEGQRDQDTQVGKRHSKQRPRKAT